ncbi:MAG: A/G-specific adenine glycosylase [Syntrophobacteraceae bacterium]
MNHIQEELLRWYSQNARDLPWRRSYSPYEVWISEIMLQQTQVTTMLPYYSRWMKRFPDPASVAQASEDEILLHWEGLGYYARAKNIQKAALLMVEEFGGELPRDFDSVRRLPGIGRYTAGAIMSFAYNADYAAADANAARIISRVFDVSSSSDTKDFQNAVWNHASEILPKGHARNFNQALMDFGSSVCLARAPLCGKCPIASLCKSLQKGVADSRPVTRTKKTLVPVRRAICILISEGEVLVRKRPEAGLMPNLWEFPGGEVRAGENPEQALRRAWLEELDLTLGHVEELALIKHAHTSFRVTLHAFLCYEKMVGRGCPPYGHSWLRVSHGEMRDSRGVNIPTSNPRNSSSAKWAAAADLDQLAFPSAHRRVIRLLMEKLG